MKEGEIVTTGGLGSNRRSYNDILVSLKVNGNAVEITSSKDKKLAKKAAKVVNTLSKELKNDMAGVTAYYEKKMATVFAHFPMVVEAKGKEVTIKNMQGERATRKAEVVGATKVEVKGQSLRVYGTSLDDVSQTAANIRVACNIRKKDHRIFQDGIYYEIEKS